MINNPNIRKFLAARNPISEQNQEDFYQRVGQNNPNDITVAVCLLDGTLIGTMGLHRIDLVNRNATTGAMLGDESYLGKGYGSDAKMQLLAHAFLELGLMKVQSRVYDFNTRSIAYSKKCGYVEEGVLKQQQYRNGTWCNEVLLAVFKDDWLPLWQKYKAT
jgi:RimJ/RimL family protein N-acetyltransferase